MFGQKKQSQAFFVLLCEDYYPKILRYTHAMLQNEGAARDCTQEVFLLACQKSALLEQHPNPGGFLFQTAKNLIQKERRERVRALLRDCSLDNLAVEPAHPCYDPLELLDREIDVDAFLESVLLQLEEDKQRLYALYYIEHRPMAEIASLLALAEPALRMRYVRLRREIIAIIAQVAEQEFSI